MTYSLILLLTVVLQILPWVIAIAIGVFLMRAAKEFDQDNRQSQKELAELRQEVRSLKENLQSQQQQEA